MNPPNPSLSGILRTRHEPVKPVSRNGDMKETIGTFMRYMELQLAHELARIETVHKRLKGVIWMRKTKYG